LFQCFRFYTRTHLKQILLQGKRKGSSFSLLHVGEFFQHHLLKRLSYHECIFLAPISNITLL
jgi:hypothetical protein